MKASDDDPDRSPGADVRLLLETNHRIWTRKITRTLERQRHDRDLAVEASQLAFVEFWFRPELYKPSLQGQRTPEQSLFDLLQRRASWRARDLKRRRRRQVPLEDPGGLGPAGPGHGLALGPAPDEHLPEPDEPYWIAMNTTQYRYGPMFHPDAIERCLAGDTQRAVASEFAMSAPTLNRQLAFFKERYALLGRPGRPTFDVALVRCLRGKGSRLVVMLEPEVTDDGSLSPRVHLAQENGRSAWICEVLEGAEEGG